MDFNVRIMQINQAITEKGIVTFDELLAITGASPATLKRDLNYMRKSLGDPIVYSRTRGGYLFAKNRAAAKRQDFFDKPSSWFTPDELYSMVTTVEDFDALEKNRRGYLSKDMRALSSRLKMALFQDHANEEELFKRVNIIRPIDKPVQIPYFEVLGQALVHRKKIRITYQSDYSGEISERVVSPLRMTYHRARWYLDAWCHERKDYRRFVAQNIKRAELIDQSAKRIAMKDVEEAFDGYYGMFHGPEAQWAVIRFTGLAAKLASQRLWHKDQKEAWLSEDLYELQVPASATSPELVADIMWFGNKAKVMAPAELQNALQKALAETLKNYEAA